MNVPTLLIAVAMASSLLYFSLAGITLIKQPIREQAGHWFTFYLILSGFWALLYVLYQSAWLPDSWDPFLFRALFYGLLLLSLHFLYLTRSFLQVEAYHYPWHLFGLGLGVSLLILDLNVLGLPEQWFGLGLSWERGTIATGVLMAGWLLFMGVTAVVCVQAYRKTERQPLHRNRVWYWILVLGLMASGDMWAFGGQLVLGRLVHLLAAFLAAYTMLVYRLSDIRRIVRGAISYSITVLIIGSIYLGAFVLVAPWFSQMTDQYNLTVWSLVLTILTAVSFHPILQVVQKGVDRITLGLAYDLNRTLRNYSMRISSIVDLGQLETTALSLISEVMEISHGTFYLIDAMTMAGGQVIYQLHSVHGLGEEKLILGSFDAGSIVAQYLVEENRPLTQHDIDLLPRFQPISPDEREWLHSLGVDVFVPIQAKGKWLGLFGLGPKISGDRYFDNDLILLGTLADQTAVALENARLVADLVRLNRDIKQAYAALASANQQLQESDKLKSSFIGVITHEMRTPFANVIFSLQLLEKYGLDNLSPEQREEIEQIGKGVQVAKGMVDNLVSFAGFLSRQGDLRLSEVAFGEIVQEVVSFLQPLADSKGVTLHVEMPLTPILIQGDRERLSDAMHHLLHNAIKFTGAEGDVWVRCWETEDSACFEVQDTGVGIPKEKLPTLWEGFAQMADPLRRGVEGLGLGLSLVKYVAVAHGGEVAADSVVDEGSTFGFCVPVDGQPVEQVTFSAGVLSSSFNG